MNSKSVGPFAKLRIALVAAFALAIAGCASAPEPTRVPIQQLLPTPLPGVLGGFDQNAWLFGTSTPTATATVTGTPGPSPTPTLTPTPVDATTLKGKLLFLSSRSLPANYAPALSNLHLISPEMFKAFSGSTGAPVWEYDPTFGKVTPCDPPPATPTPVPNGQPTPALLFGNLSQLVGSGPTVCQQVYDAAVTAQTFTSDKRFEAYVGSDPNGGRPQIFVIDHQTNTVKMVTRFGSGVSYDPAFAPDSYHLVFVSQELGTDNIYTITRDGTDLRRLTRIAGQNWPTTWEWSKRPTWSADGEEIAFWSNRVSGAREIWVMNADSSNLHTISDDPRPSEDWDPVWLR